MMTKGSLGNSMLVIATGTWRVLCSTLLLILLLCLSTRLASSFPDLGQLLLQAQNRQSDSDVHHSSLRKLA